MPIVDHISNCQVSESDGLNELITLDCLATGLGALAQQVRLFEQPIQKYELENRKRIRFFGFGFGLGLPPEAEPLIPCYFHWFGISVCNYARLVGFLAGIGSGVYSRSATEDPNNYNLIKKHCDDYVNSIPELAPIKTWRHKVFAHFAITDPHPKDNAALLDSSVISPISYFDGRFRVGGMIQVMRGAEVEMPPWSITEAFEQLGPRFWPQQTTSMPPPPNL